MLIFLLYKSYRRKVTFFRTIWILTSVMCSESGSSLCVDEKRLAHVAGKSKT